MAFDIRTKGDYRDFVVLDKDKVQEMLENAKLFVGKSKDIIEKFIFDL